MTSKKPTPEEKDENAEGTVEDAKFAGVDDEIPAAGTEDKEIADATEPGETHDGKSNGGPIPQDKRGGFIAWLALVAAIAALAAVGVDFLRDRSMEADAVEDDATMASVTSTVRAVQASIDSLQRNVTALSDGLAEQDSEIAAIGRRLGDRLQQIEALGGRLSTIEGSVASLQGISTGARNAWLLAEAEYYMRIANAQLQLAGNPELASLALGLADERILQLADPALTDVRRALSRELRELEMMETPDTAGITLTLASLADHVASLPLKQDIILRSDDGGEMDPELTGTDRALASLRNAFRSAFSVRQSDEALQPLIAPEAEYFLRANLSLQFQAARLAVLRGEERIFRESLDDAAAWLRQYFDTDGAATRSALQTIDDFRGSVFKIDTPDISGSLRLLRQYIALEDAATGPAIGTQDEPAAEPEQ